MRPRDNVLPLIWIRWVPVIGRQLARGPVVIARVVAIPAGTRDSMSIR
jgi:hypothetical protein